MQKAVCRASVNSGGSDGHRRIAATLGDVMPQTASTLLLRNLHDVFGENRPALLALGEVYLATPAPDANFVPDFQTDNFDSRLWELYLLAAFREQGIKVAQGAPSPDFKIERDDHVCHVEAVTANTPGARVQGFTMPQQAPVDLKERLLGAPATRFAKTLRSKLQREY
jgi:hypothetical protein